MIDPPQILTLEPRTTAVVRGVVPESELVGFFDRAFAALLSALDRQGIAPAGPAFAYYHRHPGETVDLEVGFPTDRAVAADGEVVAGALPGARVARTVHRGSFEETGGAWERLGEWIQGQGETYRTDFWEVYLVEPTPDMDPADLRTELNFPLA